MRPVYPAEANHMMFFRSIPASHARVTVVRPKDRPKVTGLRQETGPCHEPPSIKKMPKWKIPLSIKAAPAIQENVW